MATEMPNALHSLPASISVFQSQVSASDGKKDLGDKMFAKSL